MKNKNRRIKILIAVGVLVVGILATIVAVQASSSDYKDNQAKLIEEAKIIASVPGIFTEKTAIGEVEGIDVYAQELELLAAEPKASGSTTPYKDAMQRLKDYKHYDKLAEKYGITVTDAEISAFIDDQRKIFDNADDPEVLGFLKDYCAALQMTEDEYWSILKPIEVRRGLVKSKVINYLETNGIKDISSDAIEYSIFDTNYKDKIEGK